MAPTPITDPTPNQHAHHPGFSGVRGALVAATLAVGRRPVAELAADLVAVGADDHVVDVGCGPGTAVRVAARRGATAVGVDPADVMLAAARRLTLGRSSSIEWVEGVAESLPLADASVTVVWSLATVHHWSDVDVGVREAGRVLRAGGRFLALERHVREGATGLASHGWRPEQAEAFADACGTGGFADVEVVTRRGGRRDVLAVLARRP